MAVLFLIVFLDLVGFGMILPVFPFYAERVGVYVGSGIGGLPLVEAQHTELVGRGPRPIAP